MAEQPSTQQMTAHTTALTASGAPGRHPDRQVDSRGVVIGPWTPRVREVNRLLRSR